MIRKKINKQNIHGPYNRNNVKMIRSILLTGFIAGVVTLYLPWWMVAVICFLEALFIHQFLGWSFFFGFLSIAILLTGFIAGVVTLYLPWWMVAVICFLEALFIPQKPGRSFITGFLSIAIL